MDRNFIEQIAESAIKYYPEYKILPSLTIAQFIKESNWGKSSLSAKYFNFAGMKWVKGCGYDYVELPTKEWDGSKYITVNAKFRRAYSYDEGVKMYYDFISRYKRYANLIGEKSASIACKKIQEDGWATSPTYATSLYNDYILKYDLAKYDMIAISGKEIIKEDNNEVIPEDSLYDTYVVVRGDNLWNISRKYYGFGNKYKKIVEYNKLQSSVIYPGQILKIPKGV